MPNKHGVMVKIKIINIGKYFHWLVFLVPVYFDNISLHCFLVLMICFEIVAID